MQVAIASSDAVNVDEHFGRAGRFLIYVIEGKVQTLLAIRTLSAPYSAGAEGHGFEAARFAEIVGKFNGCERLYCTRIGEKPAEELREQGIEPVIYQGPIRGINI